MSSRTTPLLAVLWASLSLSAWAQPTLLPERASLPEAASIQRDAGSTRLAGAQQILRKRPPVFVENRGQWDRRAKFLLRSPGLDLWVTNNGFVYDLNRIERVDTQAVEKGPRIASASRSVGHVGQETQRMRVSRAPVFITFDDASSGATAVGSGRLPEYHNYLFGNDRSKWATHVPLYSDARVQGLYKGVDAVFYLDQGRPRYDLVVGPGADPSQIRMTVDGATSVRVAPSGALEIVTPLGTVEQRELFAYQSIDGRKSQVRCRFVAGGSGRVSFRVGAYDRTRPLVIDPLVYSTYLGGSGDDLPYAIAADGNANLYVVGITSSTDYPTSSGAFSTISDGYYDILLTRLDPSASGSAQLVSSTYLGGSGYDVGEDLAIDGSGNVYLTGNTGSADFPTSLGAFSTTAGSSVTAFVMKLDPSATGSAQLMYSTFLGGSTFDVGAAIEVDAGGDILVTGITNSSDFPVSSNAYSAVLNAGSYDAFLTKLDPSATGSAQLVYSTFLGGSDYDAGIWLAIDGSGNACILGFTASIDLPTSSGAFATTQSGSIYSGWNDLFVTKIDPSATGSAQLVYSTYVGGSMDDFPQGIAVDGIGNIYMTGSTNSPDYPTTGNPYASTSLGPDGTSDMFVTKLDPSATGSAQLAFSTYIGGTGEDWGYGIALDPTGAPWIIGTTSSTDYPTSADAYAAANSGGYDVAVTKLDLSATGSAQISYSTYIGGSDSDFGNGIAADANGAISICGFTYSSDYPTSSGAYSSTISGGLDGFVTRIGSRSIELTSFDGGSYCAGSTRSIEWTSAGVASITIELSSDGGATYPTTIVSATSASTGSYSWSIPANQSPGSSYRLRIADASDAAIADVSSTSFTIDAPAAITSQPQNIVACTGAPATLSVGATGSGLTYQWTKAGAAIFGATSSSYVINNPTVTDMGYYNVVVTGTCGSPVSSSFMLLTVTSSQVITLQPIDRSVCPGANTTFTVSATGASLAYQWRKDGVNIPGAISASYTINNVTPAHAGSYSVIVSGSCPTSVTSNSAALIVPTPVAIVTQPASQSICQGNSATFSVIATGTGLTYQWRYNNSNIPGATLPSYTASAAGNYRVMVTGVCGSPVTSNPASLSFTPAPSIVTQPSSRTLCSGTGTTFNVTATGSGLAYQWRLNGSNITGANASSYSINSVSPTHQGTYTVVVSGTCAPSVTSNSAVLTVNTSPAITVHPASQSVIKGGDVTFTVTATGAGLTFQWKRNNTNISGATGSSFSITKLKTSDAATYSVVVSGTCSPSVTSNGATLAVPLFKPAAPVAALGEEMRSTITIAPNPVRDVARLDLMISPSARGERTLKVYDELGVPRKDLGSAVITSGSLMLDVSDLPAGRYHVQLRIGEHDTVEVPLIVAH